MMRTRSRHRATARSRFAESSQNPPSAASDRVISTIALTATRPARRRSRSASPIRNPSTRSALVLHEPPALERERGHVAVLERPEVVAEHLDVAVGGQIITVEEPEQRRLARPGGSGEDHELALVDAKGDVAQRGDLHGPDRIDLRDAVKLNHRGHFDYSGPPQILESFSSRRRLTMPGLALPRVAFMTWPTRALAAAVLPRL